MSPPARPPRPIPRFIITRCIANAWCRCGVGVSPAMSDDWLGQKPPFPAPAIALNRKPCHGCSTKARSEEHTSELQSRQYLVCRLLLEKKKKENQEIILV